MSDPTITQADRDEAARFISPMAKPSQLSVRIGEADDIDLVQAFARHREQAVAEKDKRIAELEAALSEVLDFADQSNVNEYARCPECSDIECVARQALRQPKEQDDE